MRERGLEPREVAGAFSHEAGQEAARGDRSRCHPLPTAVIAANDLVAVGAMGVFESHGLRVPDDISVVGYDDSQIARLDLVQLTSVCQGVGHVRRRGDRAPGQPHRRPGHAPRGRADRDDAGRATRPTAPQRLRRRVNVARNALQRLTRRRPTRPGSSPTTVDPASARAARASAGDRSHRSRGSPSPGTSATYSSPRHGRDLVADQRSGSPRRSERGRGRGSSAGAGCATAASRARVSAARANGVPGWSTAVLRFSRVDDHPLAGPSSATL